MHKDRIAVIGAAGIIVAAAGIATQFLNPWGWILVGVVVPAIAKFSL